MRAVYKYRLHLPVTVLELPKDARPLFVDAQGEDAYLWAIVQPDAEEKETRSFTVLGTGRGFPEDPDVKYVGSFQIEDALGAGEPFVGHVFETPEW